MAYEKDQHPSAKLARIICLTVMAVATLLVLLCFGILFESMSETSLVVLSFVWVSLMGFGIGGMLLAHKGVGPAIGIGIAIAVGLLCALMAFFVTIWPSL